MEYLSTLAKHTQAVNVVRFDPKGEVLATAGDDGTVLLWTLSESIVKEFGQDPDEDIQESWILRHACRSSTSEVYDLAWSPDSKYIITGSTDNVSRIYDASNGQQVCQIAEHNHFVQGVAWDPLGRFVATQSADRSVHIYSLNSVTSKDQLLSPAVFYKISRTELPTRATTSSNMGPPTPSKSQSEDDSVSRSSTADISEGSIRPIATSATTPQSPAKSPSPSPLPAVRSQNAPLLNFNNLKNSMLYHTENLESFFRRLAFSPDGSFLFTPSGVFKNSSQSDENKEELINTVYIYSRSGLNKPPVAHLPGLSRPALAISFSPIFYELDQNTSTRNPIFQLPYKMVYAVATQDSVIVYDTQHEAPLGTVSNIHYRTLTDLTWNADGESIVISAADGFCSVIKFTGRALGTKLSVDHRTLLPTQKDEDNKETKMQSPASVKKRTNNGVMEITGLVKKKAKPISSEVVEGATRIVSETTPKKIETILVTDDENQSSEASSTTPQVVFNPPVKQKKKVAPINIDSKPATSG